MPKNTTSSQQFKQCSACDVILPATTEHFHRQKKAPSGLAYHCKQCRKQERREYYLKNREHSLTMGRRWAKANPDKTAAINQRFHKRNPGKAAEYHKRWVDNNREHMQQYWREYDKKKRATNPDKMREQALARGRRWIKRNPERKREVARNSMRRRRAKIRKAEGQHTTKDIRQMYQSQQGRCWYCQVDVGDDYHVDHRVPLSRGGSDNPSNLVIACPDCNRRKNDKLPHEWNGRLL